MGQLTSCNAARATSDYFNVQPLRFANHICPVVLLFRSISLGWVVHGFSRFQIRSMSVSTKSIHVFDAGESTSQVVAFHFPCTGLDCSLPHLFVWFNLEISEAVFAEY